MLIGIIQFTGETKGRQVPCRHQVLLQATEGDIQCRKGDVGHTWVKGHLTPVTEGMKRA